MDLSWPSSIWVWTRVLVHPPPLLFLLESNTFTTSAKYDTANQAPTTTKALPTDTSALSHVHRLLNILTTPWTAYVAQVRLTAGSSADLLAFMTASNPATVYRPPTTNHQSPAINYLLQPPARLLSSRPNGLQARQGRVMTTTTRPRRCTC